MEDELLEVEQDEADEVAACTVWCGFTSEKPTRCAGCDGSASAAQPPTPAPAPVPPGLWGRPRCCCCCCWGRWFDPCGGRRGCASSCCNVGEETDCMKDLENTKYEGRKLLKD